MVHIIMNLSAAIESYFKIAVQLIVAKLQYINMSCNVFLVAKAEPNIMTHQGAWM